MKGRFDEGRWRAVLGLALAAGCLAGTAAAQCPAKVFNQDLVQPRVIRPVNGVVDTSLTVRLTDHACIPIWISKDANNQPVDNPRWEWKQMSLRTYGSPRDPNKPNDPNPIFTIPGPTFRVRKVYLKDPTKPPGPGNPQVSPGTRLRLMLRNELPNNAYPYHDCKPAEVQEPPPPGSQTGQKYKQTPPECFHGPDVTNVHYHGSHVSPQPHQDFVLLELFSSQQTNPAPPPPDETVAVGSYQTDLHSFPWNQAPGTHWYHPHKHGSTALQVLNGMAGALLVQGPFDDWLYAKYGVDPNDDRQLQAFEKVMVVQQLWPELNYYQKPHPNYPPQPLINGQADPVVRMRYGEVQRWRLIGATMQASAQITLDFPEGFEIRQIAQDGVQFAPENWTRQPLLNEQEGTFSLAPGNRVDLLVKAPPAPAGAKAAEPARHPVTFQLFGHVADDVRAQLREVRRQRQTKTAAASSTSAAAPQTASLFTIELAGSASMDFPSDFPPMPWFLRDVDPSEVVRERTIAFSMTDPATGIATLPGTQPNSFWINKETYNPNCANQTMIVGTAEAWTVSNDSSPNHPFHIHINPFQVVNYDGQQLTPPYVWQDTIALPKVTCQDQNAGPLDNQQQAEQTCPGVCQAIAVDRGQTPYTWNGQWRTTVPGQQSVCGCCQGPALRSVQFRTRFEDYTGGYVYHCHFLGHEDRGMMHNVQVVCPADSPDRWKYGAAQPDDSADDCGAASPYPPLPACPPYGTEEAGASHKH